MWAELPEGIGESEFDYVGDADRYDPRFFKYRGAWYDAFEFEYISDQPCYASFRGKWGIYYDRRFRACCRVAILFARVGE